MMQSCLDLILNTITSCIRAGSPVPVLVPGMDNQCNVQLCLMKMAAGETLHQLLRSDFAGVLGCPKEVSVYQLNMPNKFHDNMNRSVKGHCLAEVLWNVLIAPG